MHGDLVTCVNNVPHISPQTRGACTITMWPSGANHRRDTNGSDTLHQRVSMQGSGWGGNLRLSDLDFKERIGVGCMNVEVFRATKRGVQDVAVKKIPKGAVDDISSISSEVSTMERVKGPNVLQVGAPRMVAATPMHAAVGACHTHMHNNDKSTNVHAAHSFTACWRMTRPS